MMNRLDTLIDLPGSSFLAIHHLHGDDARKENPKAVPQTTDFQILWVQEASEIHRTDKMNYSIRSNTIFCGLPAQLHHLTNDDRLNGYLISFNESFLSHGNDDTSGVYGSDFFEMFSRFSAIELDKEMAGEMAGIVQKMVKESGSQRLLGTELTRRYLKIFLLYLLQQFQLSQPASAKSAGNALVKRFIGTVEKDFRLKKSVSAYAGQLGVTANHLNEAVKKVLGHSAGYHIRQRIIQEAKRKATFSDSNMKEIAYDLGFDDSSHFSKFFKNYAGVNFSYFKKAASTMNHPLLHQKREIAMA